MWSHGITDASIGAGESVSIENMACRECDRSSMPYDIRHTMTTNVIYQLPVGQGRRFLNRHGVMSALLGGWEASGIATARTGQPVNIVLKRPTSALPDGNNANQRPNLVPGVPLYAANQTVDNWFNPAAFAIPAAGTWGNLGRYAVRGPGYSEFDAAIQKHFSVTERARLNLRTEVFNLFNQAIYANPSGNLGSNPASPAASFGRITSILNTGAVGTGTPREIQFALRLEF
jgi:hypothetical protein